MDCAKFSKKARAMLFFLFLNLISLNAKSFSEADRDAISRVVIAEAGNQGEAGISAVIYVIINRLNSGEFGSNINSVLNAKGQFEPVMKAGKGDWRGLKKVSKTDFIKVNTLLNLILSGHFKDPTEGALYFQNPTIVSKRERAKKVSKGLTHFGGTTPSLIINSHAFYKEIKYPAPKKKASSQKTNDWDVFNNPSYAVNLIKTKKITVF